MTQRDICEAVRANKDPVAISVVMGEGTHSSYLEIAVTLDENRGRVHFFKLFESTSGRWLVIGEGVTFGQPSKLLAWCIARERAELAASLLGHVP